jgi:hypothetical protein
MLPGRQAIVHADPSTHKRGHKYGRPQGIEQAEPDRFHECAAIFERAHRFAVQVPLGQTRLLKFGFGHGLD